jgi:hypothetical protein
MAVQIGRTLTEAGKVLAGLISAFAAKRQEVIQRVNASRESDDNARRAAGFSPRIDPEREAMYQQMKEDQLAAAQQSALDELDELEAQVDAEIGRVRSAVEAELHPTPSNTDEQLLQEMRRGRAWDRLVRILDAEYDRSRSIYSALEDAIDLAREEGGETFLVLRSELGPWVQAHDEGLRAPVYRQHVYTAMKDYLNGSQLEAIEVLEEMERGSQRIGEALNLTRQAIRGGRVALDLAGSIPGWEVGNDIEVSTGS